MSLQGNVALVTGASHGIGRAIALRGVNADQEPSCSAFTDKPLAQVLLRSDVRKLCWQLFGPPPEHPEFARLYPKGKKDPEPPKAEPRPPVPEHTEEEMHTWDEKQLPAALFGNVKKLADRPDPLRGRGPTAAWTKAKK